MIEFSLLTLLIDFSVNTDTNLVSFLFCEFDLDFYFLKLLIFVISHLTSASNLIKF